MALAGAGDASFCILFCRVERFIPIAPRALGAADHPWVAVMRDDVIERSASVSVIGSGVAPPSSARENLQV